MAAEYYVKHLLILFFAIFISAIDLSAQTTISEIDTAYYRQKITELESELALKGLGNSRVYNLAAYHSILGETVESITYLQMAVENGLLILTAIKDPDLENARTAPEWPALRKKIIGNWYKYYPFGDADYALELIKMKINYLNQRHSLEKIHAEFDSTSEELNTAIAETLRLAQENGEKLDSLIVLHGWPRQNFVGQAQTRAAALILIYSDLKIQKLYIYEIEKAVEYNEIEGRYYATITDKIRMAEGDKQLFGTQYLYNDSTESFEIAPIENESDVEKRRSEWGLNSLDDFLKGVNVVPD